MRRYLLLCFLISFVSTGCATAEKPMYIWGDYTSSLYKLKKDSSRENLEKHKEVLATILKESERNQIRVPPGVYAEYGYILMKEGRTDEALKYLDLEEKTYPESAVFIQRLKSKLRR